jgi:hypothetical protein
MSVCCEQLTDNDHGVLRTFVKAEYIRYHLCLANCYEGRYYRQIAPRKADASPFLNGLGDSETIGAAKRTATKSAHTA